MGACRRASVQGDRGAVALEFALVLPLLVMLLLGIVTFGLAYSDHVALTNAVREGARFGAATDNVSSWGSSVAQRTVDVYDNADNPLTTASVCAVLYSNVSTQTPPIQPVAASDPSCETGGTVAGDPPSNPSNPGDDSCFVKVWATQPAHLNWFLATTTVTMSASSVSYYDRSLSCP